MVLGGLPSLGNSTHSVARRPTPRLAKQAAGGHLAGAEDYVDAVYMVLAAAAANAAFDALVRNPTGQVDGVYVVLGGLPSLGNSTHSVARRPTPRLAKQAAGGHLAGAEDYVDAVYMVLAAAAHARANAACDALV